MKNKEKIPQPVTEELLIAALLAVNNLTVELGLQMKSAIDRRASLLSPPEVAARELEK